MHGLGKTFGALFVTALAAILVLEGLARGSLVSVVGWAWDRPAQLGLNLTLVLLFMAALAGLSGRLGFGLVSGFGLLTLLAAINAKKLQLIQTPFFAWDLLYTKQLYALVAPMVPVLIWWGLAFLVPLTALAVFVGLRRRSRPLGGRLRFGCLALAVGGTCFLGANPFLCPLDGLGVENIYWDHRENHGTNGFLLAFAINLSPLLIQQPQTYNEDVVARLLEHNRELGRPAGLGKAREPVSLIIFMSESFADLQGAAFQTEEEPLPNFRQLSRLFPSFRLVSPSFGGNTSNVEFEVLTGLTNALLPPGAVPFDHYLRQEIPALPWFLRERGYRTIAVHPFHDWFWNRRQVYPNLGFDRFIHLDDFREAHRRGYYVSDEALVDKIVEVVQEERKPFLIHAVSMQNHGPYTPGRYAPDEVNVRGAAPAEVRHRLQTYMTGLRDADRQLSRLIAFLETRPEPIICVFFGDHQPSLALPLISPDGRRQPRFASQSREVQYSLSKVPGLIWANREGVIDPGDIPKNFSPLYLAPIVLHQMGHPLPGHMFYLRQGLRDYPVIHRAFVKNSLGELFDLSEVRQDSYLQGLEILQYDLLFGEGFQRRFWPPVAAQDQEPASPQLDSPRKHRGSCG